MNSHNQDELPLIRAHVLGQFVFCPRAAILAEAIGDDDGLDQPDLGPKLHSFHDFDERRFAAFLELAWGRLWWHLTLLAPAVVVPAIVARLGWPIAGIVLTLPAFYLASRLWGTWNGIQQILEEMKRIETIEPESFDPQSDELRTINWWSLRKGGYDCELPKKPYFNSEQQLTGKPWRVLTKGTLRVPVLVVSPNETKVWPKHWVRIAMYCRLIESCEGVSSPFGVLLRATSDDCVLVPRTARAVELFERAAVELRELWRECEDPEFIPPEPFDNRCRGCHWGEPRDYVRSSSETIVDGLPIDPTPIRGNDRKLHHSDCGDYYEWAPPHQDAIDLGIAEPR